MKRMTMHVACVWPEREWSLLRPDRVQWQTHSGQTDVVRQQKQCSGSDCELL